MKLKKQQIAEATEDGREIERSELGNQLDDNINQLLASSNLYFNMAKKGGQDSELYLNQSSEFTLTAIKEITGLTKGLPRDLIKNFGLDGSLKNLVSEMMAANSITIVYKFENFIEHSVSDKLKINLFRIVKAQLKNLLKHRSVEEIIITVSQNEIFIDLSISANSLAFDFPRMDEEIIATNNIKGYVQSCNGSINFDAQPGSGCVLTVAFPVTESC